MNAINSRDWESFLPLPQIYFQLDTYIAQSLQKLQICLHLIVELSPPGQAESISAAVASRIYSANNCLEITIGLKLRVVPQSPPLCLSRTNIRGWQTIIVELVINEICHEANLEFCCYTVIVTVENALDKEAECEFDASVILPPRF